MIEKIFLDALTTDTVSVKKQNYITINGIDYAIGEIWRKAYVNSVQGRQAIQNEVPSPYREAIFAVWGDNTTVE